MESVLNIQVAGKAPQSIHLNASLTWPDVANDFTLRCEGHRIGRLWLARDSASPETPWEWHINVPMAMPNWASGTAASFEIRMQAFVLAWGRFLIQADPERLERAWDIERAAELRR